MNKQSIQNYYDLLEATLKENNLTDCPGQIYNMDETGMPLDPRAPNVVAKAGQKKIRYRQSGKKEQITIIGCGNAVGQSIPPMVIFEGKYLNHEWTIGEIPGTLYGMSGKGWTDHQLFLYWFKHFLKHANPTRPLLLLLDGHLSHFELSSIKMAAENQVSILCLPPHTTHESQPLDSSVFGPLKKNWTEICHDFQQQNPGAVITKYNFSKLFAQAWLKSLSAQNLISGFKKCGIYPFDRAAIEIIDDSPTEPSNHTETISNHSPTEPTHKDKTISGYSPTEPAHNDETISGYSPTEPANNNELASSSFLLATADENESITEAMASKFERRFEEGYDLPDPMYQKWLAINHPEVNKYNTPHGSLVNFFPDASTPDPAIIVEDDSNRASISEPNKVPSSFDTTASVSDAHKVPSSTIRPGHQSVNKTNNNSIIYEFLETPTPKFKSRTSTRAVTTARVLTSSECLSIIREKEMKKRAEEEEKQKRKLEREEKKKRAEKEKQRKAQEQAQRLAEKLEKAKKAEEEKLRKIAERARRSEEKSQKSKEQRTRANTRDDTSNSQLSSTRQSSSLGKRNTSVTRLSNAKRMHRLKRKQVYK